jgi:hypothetical protein
VVFSGTTVSSTNKTDHNNITEILLKVALNTIAITLILSYPLPQTEVILYLWSDRIRCEEDVELMF